MMKQYTDKETEHQLGMDARIPEDLSSKTYEPQKPTLFLSYCTIDSPIANIIEEKLISETNNGITISRYTRLPYRASFKAFMNSIQKHDFVLCIVSDSYLKSQACMYEVGEIIKDHDFSKKLLFVVLNESDAKYYDTDSLVAARIYGEEKNRMQYILYWQKKYQELDCSIEQLHKEARTPAELQLKEIGNIARNDIGEFLAYLADNNGKNFEELYNNDFSDILCRIFPNWRLGRFKQCADFSELLVEAIRRIKEITITDYNQIALNVTTSKYENGLVVFADDIPPHKQRYRLVIMEGLMGYAFTTGNILNIKDTNNESKYFIAVRETKSELVVPIRTHGNIIGVINSESEDINHYSDSMIEKISNIANGLAVSLSKLGYTPNLGSTDIPYIHITSN